MDYNYDGAYEFYKLIIKGIAEKAAFYDKHGFGKPPVHEKDWEVFGAILTNDTAKNGKKAKGGQGTDLKNGEIKSACSVNKSFRFEYQYHKNSALAKLEEDKLVDHYYVLYDKSYQNIKVWKLPKEQFALYVETKIVKGKHKGKDWKQLIVEAYYSGKSSQRCRPGMSYKYVVENGEMIMEIENGILKKK